MEEAGSGPVGTNAQEEDKIAEPHHPVSEDNQEEHTETLEDKTTEPEHTINSNQDGNIENNGIDPALLQSEEPKSKVIMIQLFSI